MQSLYYRICGIHPGEVYSYNFDSQFRSTSSSGEYDTSSDSINDQTGNDIIEHTLHLCPFPDVSDATLYPLYSDYESALLRWYREFVQLVGVVQDVSPIPVDQHVRSIIGHRPLYVPPPPRPESFASYEDFRAALMNYVDIVTPTLSNVPSPSSILGLCEMASGVESRMVHLSKLALTSRTYDHDSSHMASDEENESLLEWVTALKELIAFATEYQNNRLSYGASTEVEVSGGIVLNAIPPAIVMCKNHLIQLDVNSLKEFNIMTPRDALVYDTDPLNRRLLAELPLNFVTNTGISKAIDYMHAVSDGVRASDRLSSFLKLGVESGAHEVETPVIHINSVHDVIQVLTNDSVTLSVFYGILISKQGPALIAMSMTGDSWKVILELLGSGRLQMGITNCQGRITGTLEGDSHSALTKSKVSLLLRNGWIPAEDWMKIIYEVVSNRDLQRIGLLALTASFLLTTNIVPDLVRQSDAWHLRNGCSNVLAHRVATSPAVEACMYLLDDNGTGHLRRAVGILPAELGTSIVIIALLEEIWRVGCPSSESFISFLDEEIEVVIVTMEHQRQDLTSLIDRGLASDQNFIVQLVSSISCCLTLVIKGLKDRGNSSLCRRASICLLSRYGGNVLIRAKDLCMNSQRRQRRLGWHLLTSICSVLKAEIGLAYMNVDHIVDDLFALSSVSSEALFHTNKAKENKESDSIENKNTFRSQSKDFSSSLFLTTYIEDILSNPSEHSQLRPFLCGIFTFPFVYRIATTAYQNLSSKHRNHEDHHRNKESAVGGYDNALRVLGVVLEYCCRRGFLLEPLSASEETLGLQMLSKDAKTSFLELPSDGGVGDVFQGFQIGGSLITEMIRICRCQEASMEGRQYALNVVRIISSSASFRASEYSRFVFGGPPTKGHALCRDVLTLLVEVVKGRIKIRQTIESSREDSRSDVFLDVSEYCMSTAWETWSLLCGVLSDSAVGSPDCPQLIPDFLRLLKPSTSTVALTCVINGITRLLKQGTSPYPLLKQRSKSLLSLMVVNDAWLKLYMIYRRFGGGDPIPLSSNGWYSKKRDGHYGFDSILRLLAIIVNADDEELQLRLRTVTAANPDYREMVARARRLSIK